MGGKNEIQENQTEMKEKEAEFAGSIWFRFAAKSKIISKKLNSNAMSGGGGDADMMEAEAPREEAGAASEPNDIRNLLAMARRLINEGKPSQALEAVTFSPLPLL